MQAGLIPLLLLLCHLASPQAIVDFTYSEYTHSRNDKAASRAKLEIHPSRTILSGYDFPNACSIARRLTQGSLDDSSEPGEQDSDSFMDQLKAEFVELLRVGEKLKKKKSNIQRKV